MAEVIKDDRYYNEGCSDCGNTKKTDTLIEKNDYLYKILLEKIQILNDNIPELFKLINSHQVKIATIDQSVNNLYSDTKVIAERNTEDHRQIHAKIQRENDAIKTVIKEEIKEIRSKQYELIKEVNQNIGVKTLIPIIISFIAVIATLIVPFLK